jgi:multidrug efflux pump subunit AcrA (membrane-fusion protein)
MKNINHKIAIFGLLIFSLSSCKGRPTEAAKVERKDLTELVFASGSLQAEEQYFLTAQADGQILQLDLHEGDLLKVHEIVGLIDNSQSVINANSAAELYQLAERNNRNDAPALQQIEANLAAAKQKLEQDKLQEARFKRLLEQNIGAQIDYENRKLATTTSEANVRALEQQYQSQRDIYKQQTTTQRAQLKSNRASQANNEIQTLVGGKVYILKKQIGDYVRRGDVIAVIANPNRIYARLLIDETAMAGIALGQKVWVQLNTHKNKTLNAQISEILPQFDAQNQSFIVKATFTDSLNFTILGTQLEANVLLGEKKNALVIPRTFLGYGNKVLLPDNKNSQVKTGIVSNEWVEILDGLKEGETILRYL